MSYEEIITEPLIDINEIIQAEERKSRHCNLVAKGHVMVQEVIERFSSATKIERVLAYMLRFISNSTKQSNNRNFGQLSLAEVQRAHQRIIEHIHSICGADLGFEEGTSIKDL